MTCVGPNSLILTMQNIGYIIDKLLRNHINKIIVIHLISYQAFEQLGSGLFPVTVTMDQDPYVHYKHSQRIETCTMTQCLLDLVYNYDNYILYNVF